jgi:hypothetical protein
LGCQIVYSDKSAYRLWTTTSFEKSTVSPSLFKHPSGYKLATSADELNAAATAYTPALEDMLNDMKIGKPFGN